MGYLNILGWVALKSDVSLSDKMNEYLVKNMLYQKGIFWERLVNTEYQKSFLFPSNYNNNRFKKNVDIPFHILEIIFKYDFFVAIYYSKHKFQFTLLDFKMYRPNLITNDGFIDCRQKAYRDYQVTFPKTIVKLKKKTIRNKHRNDKDIQYQFIHKLTFKVSIVHSSPLVE